MSRNGTGTHTIPNTMSSATPILASKHNENYTDLSAEITNSVAADGQTTMTGPLKLSSGTANAPGATFGADTNTGIYRIGADNIGIAAGGSKIADISATGLDVTGAITVGGSAPGIVGEIRIYAGATEPTGWVFCYGQAISRTTYAALFTALSTTYGVGDGSTTFNVPDLRGRVVAGQDDMGGTSANRLTGLTGGLDGDTLGATGGAETHTLTLAQLPASPPAGAIGGSQALTGLNTGSGPTTTTAAGGLTGPSNLNDTRTVLGSNFTLPNLGSGSAFNIVQPTMALNYIIKT